MKYATRLNSSTAVDILLVFADLFTKKANKRKPSLVRSPEILLRGSFARVRHATVNKPIKAEYFNF